MMKKSTEERITYSKTERIKIDNIHTDRPIDTSKRNAAKTKISVQSLKKNFAPFRAKESEAKNFAPLRFCEQKKTQNQYNPKQKTLRLSALRAKPTNQNIQKKSPSKMKGLL